MNIRSMCGRSTLSAFSLVELLIALCLAGTLSIPIALTVREGRETRTMESAQDLVGAHLNAARMHAIVSGKPCRLLVYSGRRENSELQWKLRSLIVAISNGDGTWSARDEPICLPGNIRMVPRIAPPTLNPGGWGTAPLSTISGDTLQVIHLGDRHQSGYFYFVEFNSLGNTGGGTIVLSPGINRTVGDAGEVSFNHPNEISGIRVSQYGALTMLASASAF